MLTQDGDAAVLLNKKTGKYFRLNPLGVKVFEMLSSGRSIPSIVSELQEKFPQASDRIPDDIQKLVDDMRTAKVVTGP
ncbi:PqqD family peptide modification chaperone [Streptomyces sp. NPDC093097]|uniref:PqqD family peptide modification chaperone n=1 Tax=Streptomyces sp. NPDC093097 TaxID=3366027 RepID=UPI0038268F71